MARPALEAWMTQTYGHTFVIVGSLCVSQKSSMPWDSLLKGLPVHSGGWRGLERAGEIFRDVSYYKNRPVNTYLAIDPNDERFRARIVDDHGWIFVVLEWLDKDRLPSRSTSIQMGELGDYVESHNNELVIEWPPLNAQFICILD